MINITELRPGNYFTDKNQIFIVLDILLNKTAMRKMIAKIKVKNIRSGAITNITQNSGYMVELLHLDKKAMLFSYKLDNNYIFIDKNTYEQIEIDEKKLEWEKNFLVSNTEINVLSYNNEILGISLPAKIAIKVIDCEPAIKGDTVRSAMKDAILETNFKLKVPLFINKGEIINVKTSDGTYEKRFNDKN